VYITIESPNNVARHLLEDLARMTKAGTSPLPLLHMTAALGCA
jgi:IS1 family transposase